MILREACEAGVKQAMIDAASTGMGGNQLSAESGKQTTASVWRRKRADFQFNTDRWPQELASTALDVALPAGLGAGIGALGGRLSDDSDAGKGAIRGLLAGAGAGLGSNIGHRATAERSFWKGLTTGHPYTMNMPAVGGSAAAGGGLGYLLGRKLTQDD